MTSFSIIPAERHHIRQVIADVRPEDATEWAIASDEMPLHVAIQKCLQERGGWAIVNEYGQCLVLWGCNHGTLWLIATQAGQQAAAEIHRKFWPEVKGRLLADGSQIEAHVYTRNTTHVEWLVRAGFERVGPSEVIAKPDFDLYVLRPR